MWTKIFQCIMFTSNYEMIIDPYSSTWGSVRNIVTAVVMTRWEPSLCEDDGNGSDMSCDGSKTTALAQPFTGHQRGDAGDDNPRSPGVGLWKQN